MNRILLRIIGAILFILSLVLVSSPLDRTVKMWFIMLQCYEVMIENDPRISIEMVKTSLQPSERWDPGIDINHYVSASVPIHVKLPWYSINIMFMCVSGFWNHWGWLLDLNAYYDIQNLVPKLDALHQIEWIWILQDDGLFQGNFFGIFEVDSPNVRFIRNVS